MALIMFGDLLLRSYKCELVYVLDNLIFKTDNTKLHYETFPLPSASEIAFCLDSIECQEKILLWW